MNGSNNTSASTNTAPKKRKGRFNFVDLTLIIVAVLLVGAIVYLVSPVSLIKNWINKEAKVIRYEVEFTNVDEKFIDNIKAGDAVIDGVSKNALGTVIVDVDHNTKYSVLGVEPVVDADNTPTGEYKSVMIEYPDKYNVRVTIEADANFYEGKGYTVNSKRIAVGEKLSLKFPEFAGEGYCVNVIEY